VAEVVPDGHFNRELIFLFPKSLARGGGEEKISDIPFLTNSFEL
jgi:hypothetical protein